MSSSFPLLNTCSALTQSLQITYNENRPLAGKFEMRVRNSLAFQNFNALSNLLFRRFGATHLIGSLEDLDEAGLD